MSNITDTDSVADEGERYYFCSQRCLEKFQDNPAECVKPVVM